MMWMMETMADSDDGPEVSDEASTPHDPNRKSGADLARDAMARARASARQRGAYRTSPTAARAKRETKRRESQPFAGGRDPLAMSEAVETLLRRMGWTEQIEVSGVTGRWREVVGDQIADHCEPLGFDEGVLTVKASSTAWATQLTIMSGQIRHRINEEFGRDIVREIKVAGPTTRSWTKGPRTVKGRGPRDTYG
jgi:predicted nucleic acid-binding Zn ribbon protein